MHSQLKAGRLAHRVLATTLLFVPIILTPGAPAAPLFLSVDEWGKGFVCDGGGGLGGGSAIPLCQPSGVSPFGTFERLASGFSADPTPGGGTHVLTYILPFTIATNTVDVLMIDSTLVDGDMDLLRFVGNQLFFYSTQFIAGTGDCSTMLPNMATGCDGVADVSQFPPPLRDLTQVVESGAPGDASGLYFANTSLGLAEITFQSDELTRCPTNIPNCGPLNVAPPPTDPYRDITGLNAPNTLVTLPFGFPNNPLDVASAPEPGSIWLFSIGALALALAAFRRIKKPRVFGSSK
jgi:hypothetical protein